MFDRDVKSSRPSQPRGQILWPWPHRFWPRPRSHVSWPRGLNILWYYDMQYENNMYLYVAWFIRHCGLGLICFGLGLTENFWPRPHTFWPRPWPHHSLASLTSLVFDILGRLSLLESRANRRVQKKQTNKQMHYSELQISQHSFTSDICSSIVLEIHKQLNWM